MDSMFAAKNIFLYNKMTMTTMMTIMKKAKMTMTKMMKKAK